MQHSNNNNIHRDKIIIQDLQVQVIIGAHKGERTIKQNLFLTITLYHDLSRCGETDNVEDTIDYGDVSKSVSRYADGAHHFTIEALAVGVARICCLGFNVDEVTVKYVVFMFDLFNLVYLIFNLKNFKHLLRLIFMLLKNYFILE